jgi:hypothetical protein
MRTTSQDRDILWIGELIPFSDQGGEVLEVFRVGRSAEDDLHDARIPDRASLILRPLIPRLRERLQHRHRRDPRTATLDGHTQELTYQPTLRG